MKYQITLDEIKKELKDLADFELMQTYAYYMANDDLEAIQCYARAKALYIVLVMFFEYDTHENPNIQAIFDLVTAHEYKVERS